MANPLFILVHSPLLGPYSWALVAEELQRRGYDTLTPDITTSSDDPTPFWQQFAGSFARALAHIPADRAIYLVGHSGAGPLLPLLAHAASRSAAAHIFVDAGLPEPDKSRLEVVRRESPQAAVYFQAELAERGAAPLWTDEDLAELIPDADRRAKLLAELRPQTERYWTEPIPTPENWLNAPCAYLQLSAGYAVPARQTRALGWPLKVLDGNHFWTVVEPQAVADALIDLVKSTLA